MEEEKRVIKEPQHKQLIMDIGKTKYTVNLHFKQVLSRIMRKFICRLRLNEVSRQ